MTRRLAHRLLVAISAGLLIPAGCDSGDANPDPSFRVSGISPTVSSDLNGGDTVTISGTLFQTVNVVAVRFGGSPGTNVQVQDETSLTVATPPAPGGSPQVVTVEVVSTLAGSEFLVASYTYQGATSGPPSADSITPTTFTPTGAQDFTIAGSSLGNPGATVTVDFQGVGTVSAQVSNDAQFATGRAPLSPVPPPANVSVTLTNSAGSDTVPATVNFAWSPPAGIPFPNLTADPACQPVRVAENHAVLCTPGATDGVWGTADDEVVLLTGLVTGGWLTTPIQSAGAPIGYLDKDISIPAVLDADTVVVYSVGPNGRHVGIAPHVVDDQFVHIGSIRTGPVVNRPSAAFVLLQVPPQSIGQGRLAVPGAGADGIPRNGDDDLIVVGWSGPSPNFRFLPNIGPLDNAPPPTGISVPFSADGENVFLVTPGGDGVRATGDDQLVHVTVSNMAVTMGGSVTSGQRTLGIIGAPPIALEATKAATIGAGTDNTIGTPDDTLSVFSAGGTLSRTNHILASPPNTAALVPIAAGPGGEALLPLRGILGGFADGDEKLVVFTDPTAGSSLSLDARGPAQVMQLRNAESVVFDSGGNLIPGTGDDSVRYLDATFSSSVSFALPLGWTQTAPIRGDDSRMFAVGAGSDGTGSTGDEVLLVWQTRALGAAVDAAPVPLSLPQGARAPLGLPFVPVASDWGVIVGPGPDNVFGTGDEQFLFARY